MPTAAEHAPSITRCGGDVNEIAAGWPATICSTWLAPRRPGAIAVITAAPAVVPLNQKLAVLICAAMLAEVAALTQAGSANTDTPPVVASEATVSADTDAATPASVCDC